MNMDYGISLSYVGEELVTETLALACALYEPGDVDNLDGGWDDLGGMLNLVKHLESVVGDRYDAYVRLNGAEREVGRLGLSVREAVEKSRLADIGQADYAALECHYEMLSV